MSSSRDYRIKYRYDGANDDDDDDDNDDDVYIIFGYYRVRLKNCNEVLDEFRKIQENIFERNTVLSLDTHCFFVQ